MAIFVTKEEKMGTYLIPRDLKGEGRILFFSYKALLYTVIGFVPGYIFYYVFNLIKLQTVGIVIMCIFALIGFCIGTITMPNAKGFEITRKTGGEKIDEIIMRLIKFKMKKNRIYIYDKKEEENKWTFCYNSSELF